MLHCAPRQNFASQFQYKVSENIVQVYYESQLYCCVQLYSRRTAACKNKRVLQRNLSSNDPGDDDLGGGGGLQSQHVLARWQQRRIAPAAERNTQLVGFVIRYGELGRGLCVEEKKKKYKYHI